MKGEIGENMNEMCSLWKKLRNPYDRVMFSRVFGCLQCRSKFAHVYLSQDWTQMKLFVDCVKSTITIHNTVCRNISLQYCNRWYNGIQAYSKHVVIEYNLCTISKLVCESGNLRFFTLHWRCVNKLYGKYQSSMLQQMVWQNYPLCKVVGSL